MPPRMARQSSIPLYQASATNNTWPSIAQLRTSRSPGEPVMTGSYHLGGRQFSSTSTNAEPYPDFVPQQQTWTYPYNASGRAYNQADQSRLVCLSADPQFPPHPRRQASPLQQRQHYASLSHNSSAPQYQTLYAANDSDYHIRQPTTTMSLSYESRQFSEYPQSTLMHDPHQDQEEMVHRYPSPPPPLSDNPYNAQPTLDATANLMDDMPEPLGKDESDAPSRGRSEPIPKPDREVTKDENGRFVCSWPNCPEETKSFGRKCEWSKHMDKHDRPYKCPAEGCEKLPGFTYSGGLLRHQREVHNLHGGPKKQLNCPHVNCKRYSGKGFSRQENLNEHLRRVHTDGGEMQVGEETEDDGSERTGMKRKRGSMRDDDDIPALRQEVVRLRQKNEHNERTIETLVRQVETMQNAMGLRHQQPQHHQAPPANMM